MKEQTIAVIGGGAAGFFSAISCKTHHPSANVILYEKTHKLLSKVKVSGGGRCNVTHACFNNFQFAKHYPRGEKQLKKAFHHFDVQDTIHWFENRGVKLIAEADNRMFPVTNDSQTVIDCLLREATRLGVTVKTNTLISALHKEEKGFKLFFKDHSFSTADKVIIATGGSPRKEGLLWLEQLGHTIITPVPSLFTFNMPHDPVKVLMGITIDHVQVKIQSSKLMSDGPLLITHWGMSGPAILKLSAWGARELYEKNYQFNIQINWLGGLKEEQLREQLNGNLDEIRKRKTANQNPFNLPNRFWHFLLAKADIDSDATWGEQGKKSLNKLINTLVNDVYEVSGKTTFKEEFVTCGGVSLADVSFQTMESRKCKGLYFAGEVLDIDGITGGFNFQAAWTTGFIAGKIADIPDKAGQKKN